MRALKVVKICGKKYYLDERLNQIRNVNNPHDFADIDKLTVAVLAGNI